jgi:hypothetical protein
MGFWSFVRSLFLFKWLFGGRRNESLRQPGQIVNHRNNNHTSDDIHSFGDVYRDGGYRHDSRNDYAHEDFDCIHEDFDYAHEDFEDDLDSGMFDDYMDSDRFDDDHDSRMFDDDF